MKYFIDSSAWIEYLDGSFAGEKVREILLGDNEVYIISLIVSEVLSKVKRENHDVELAYRTLVSNSKIISLNLEIAKEAGLFHAEQKKKVKNFGLVDSLILVCARKIRGKIVTLDNHFRGFKEAILLNRD